MPPRTRRRPSPTNQPVADDLADVARGEGDVSLEFASGVSPAPSPGGPVNPSLPHADRVFLQEVAAAAENVPAVRLQPPSEDRAEPAALFTPDRPHGSVHPRSGGSSAGAPVPKKRAKKGKARAGTSPDPMEVPVSDARLTVRLPARGARVLSVPSVLEWLVAAHFAGPSASPDKGPSDASPSDDLFALALFAQASQGQNLADPAVVARLRASLVEAAPMLDFLELLPLPKKPVLDLPAPSSHALLLGFLPGSSLAVGAAAVLLLHRLWQWLQ